MNWSLMSLSERVKFILMHADRIAVRVQLDGQWYSRFLCELPPVLRQTEIERLALRDVEPVRLRR